MTKGSTICIALLLSSLLLFSAVVARWEDILLLIIKWIHLISCKLTSEEESEKKDVSATADVSTTMDVPDESDQNMIEKEIIQTEDADEVSIENDKDYIY